MPNPRCHPTSCEYPAIRGQHSADRKADVEEGRRCGVCFREKAAVRVWIEAANKSQLSDKRLAGLVLSGSY